LAAPSNPNTELGRFRLAAANGDGDGTGDADGENAGPGLPPRKLPPPGLPPPKLPKVLVVDGRTRPGLRVLAPLRSAPGDVKDITSSASPAASESHCGRLVSLPSARDRGRLVSETDRTCERSEHRGAVS
jgi:hypothetical protein